MLNRLNGWQRLWVVASLLYGLFVGYIILDGFPTRDHVISQFEEAVKDRDAAWNNYDYLKETFGANLEKLPTVQAINIAFGVAYWLGGSLLVYIGGWLVGWIIRGFRKQPA
jgi:hypothetical protein